MEFHSCGSVDILIFFFRPDPTTRKTERSSLAIFFAPSIDIRMTQTLLPFLKTTPQRSRAEPSRQYSLNPPVRVGGAKNIATILYILIPPYNEIVGLILIHINILFTLFWNSGTPLNNISVFSRNMLCAFLSSCNIAAENANQYPPTWATIFAPQSSHIPFPNG